MSNGLNRLTFVTFKIHIKIFLNSNEKLQVLNKWVS